MSFENKLLKRLSKKFLGIPKKEEILLVIQKLKETYQLENSNTEFKFLDNFPSFLSEAEKAIQNLEKNVEIRDRSLTISSQEMLELNERIKKQSVELKNTFHRLQMVLKEDSHFSEKFDDEMIMGREDLDHLVGLVESLVFQQRENTKILEKLLIESQKIVSSSDLYELTQKIANSFKYITGQPIQLNVFFSSDVLGKRSSSSENRYFSVKEKGVKDTNKEYIRASAKEYLSVESPQSQNYLSIIEYEWPSDIDRNKIDFYGPFLKSLQPAIANTILNILHIKSEKNKQYLEQELLTASLVQSERLNDTIDLVNDGAFLFAA